MKRRLFFRTLAASVPVAAVAVASSNHSNSSNSSAKEIAKARKLYRGLPMDTLIADAFVLLGIFRPGMTLSTSDFRFGSRMLAGATLNGPYHQQVAQAAFILASHYGALYPSLQLHIEDLHRRYPA